MCLQGIRLQTSLLRQLIWSHCNISSFRTRCLCRSPSYTVTQNTAAAQTPTDHHPTRTDHVPFPHRFNHKIPLISFATLHDSRYNAPPPKSLLPGTPPPSSVGFYLANQPQPSPPCPTPTCITNLPSLLLQTAMPPRRNHRAATSSAAVSRSPVGLRTPQPQTAPRRASHRSSSSSPVKPPSRRSDSDEPMEVFDESVSDSIAVHNASHKVFRAFSYVFYCSSLNFLLETFSARDFIHQRRLDIESFGSRTDLVETLKAAKLFKTVTKVERFVRDVVFEFYTNLVPELTNARLAYVWGHFYEFSPRIINAYYALPGYADYFDKDLHEITRRLTGAVPIKFDQRLLSGSHFDDLGLSRDAVTAGPSSSVNCGELAIAFLEKELCLISAQRKDLVDRELQVRSLLLKLKGFGTVESDGQSPDDKVVASESASSSSDQSPHS
nr:uncharacterized protein LOC109169177 [Ipomoea batatas]